MALFCEYETLETESDVEQKFLYPLLTSKPPMGLGLQDIEIYTKKCIRQRIIGKSSRKYYFPDYLIMIRGIPVLVVEAKAPEQDLGNAFSEARLYSAEINASYPHKINVCSKIIVSNGGEVWAGYSDQDTPIIILKFDEINTENPKFVEFLEFCKREYLIDAANKPYIDLRGNTKYVKPVSQIGGKLAQNEELVENSYGRTLVFENRNIFDPETEEDRIDIVKNAYIISQKREQHMDPIYSEIKKIKLPSQQNSTLIASDAPNELVEKLSIGVQDRQNIYSLMLLIGNAGSGKSTFIRYFKTMYLEKYHQNLAKRCFWMYVNMNNAPGTQAEIYDWIRDILIENTKQQFSDIEFEDFEIIKSIFKDKIRAFEKGIGQLLIDDKASYNKELYKILAEHMSDKSNYLSSLFKFIKDYKEVIPIVVLDNCDKRDKDTQLLMFEVAQWLRTTYKCIVILPMRESTYDIYRYEPPLDTLVKDLVFRIDPPDILKVLQARLEYINRLNGNDVTSYSLENGMQVSVKKNEQIEYFKCLLMAIRKNDWARNVFFRLSNRNIRSGIQLFEDFCKSGHIQSEEIFKIRAVGNEYELPSYKLMNALLRKNRRYYDSEISNFCNILGSDYHDDIPDPFIRVDILRWLKKYAGEEGPNKQKGYFKIKDILKDLQIIGHKEEVIIRENKYVLKRELIVSENQSDNLEIDDLVKLSPSGFLHLMLLKNLSYLAACSEDVIYKNIKVMTNISRRIVRESHMTRTMMIINSKAMVDYLIQYRREFISYPDICLHNEDKIEMFDLKECEEAINDWIEKDSDLRNAIDITKKYSYDLRLECKVVNKKSGGLVCLIDGLVKGFVSSMESKYGLSFEMYKTILEGDILTCDVIEYDYERNSLQLKFIEKSDLPKEEYNI